MTDTSASTSASVAVTPWRDRGRLSGYAWHVLFWLAFVVVGLLQRLITSEGIAVLLPVAGLGVLWLLWTGLHLGALAVAAPLSALVAVSLIADVPTSVWIPSSLGTLAQILVSVALLRRWCPDLWGVGGRDDPDSVRALVLALTALGAGALAAPVLIVPLVALGDPLSAPGVALVVGRQLCGAVLVVLPALLIARAASRRPPRRRAGDEGGILELAAVVASSTAVFVVSFGPIGLPLAFALLVPAAWCALRFSTAIATLHAVLVSVAVVTVSLLDAGPFGEARETATSALLAQLFVVVVVIATMTLATGRDERRELLREVLRAQQGAVRERNLLTAVIDQMHEGVVVLDRTGGVVMHNPAAARFYDFEARELRFQPHDAQGRRLDRSEFPSSRALRGEEAVQTLTMRPRADEPDVVAEVAAIPLPEHVDGPSRALLVIRDITAEHQQRMELTAFAGVVAHDLRNPLAAIDGWVGLLAAELEDGGEPPRALVDDAVTRVSRASERMRSLIRHLLQHATSRDAVLELDDVDVTAMTRSVVADRGAEDSVEVREVPAVVADRGMLRQLMENLVGNALKYVPPGEQPQVSVDGATLPGGRVEVRVTDAGVGIPDDEKSLVFQQFYRAHAKGYAGTGLGLAICRRIVDRHGGVIEVRDNPEGRGTQIAFTLAGALTSAEGGRPVQS